SYTNGYFTQNGVDNAPLHALQVYTGYGANGVYTYGSSTIFPANSSDDTNYWVDVVFSTGGSSVAAPSFNPPAGAYTQPITISSATSGASIRYTIDGSTPSSTVGTLYSSPVA